MSTRDTGSDRMFVVMATLFALTAIAAFAPTSWMLIASVASGQSPLPPFIMHFHAATLWMWLLLLLTQSVLASRGRKDVHRKLGLMSLLLAPCLLASMYGVELLNVERTTAVAQHAAAGQPDELMQNVSGVLLIHGVSYLFFPTFYIWAILARRRDNETHKRMMILATLTLMIPGIGRLLSVTRVLPDFGLNLVDARHLWALLLVAPALAHDIVTRQHLHRAYVYGLGLLGVWMVAAHFLWGSPWWAETASKLLGVG